MRYHLLPSQVLDRADTLDYFVMDVATSYHRHQQEVADARANGRPAPAPQIPINTLQEMIERVRR